MKRFLLLLILLILPTFVYAEDNILIPNSKSGIIIEANSGKIIYEKEKDLEVSVASMTKMVAQIIILEEIESGHIKWNDIVTVSSNASSMGGSQIYLETGEKMSVEDLMKGISVASGNDATVAMAEYISGSEEKFVSLMNEKVKKLGLKHTHFSNSTGLDSDNHYSSSYDMAMIARELVVNHSEILRFSSIYEDYLRKDSDNKFWLVNTNKLIKQYEGVDGLKTGHTDNSGYCLAATAKRDNLRLIGIVLGEADSKVRNKEMIELLDYGFLNTKVKVLKKKNTVVKNIKIIKGNSSNMPVLLNEDLTVLEDKNMKKNNYSLKTHINSFNLPINKGERVGYMEAILNNKTISKVSLVSGISIDKINLIELFVSNINYVIYGSN